jgi:hypothetical protein
MAAYWNDSHEDWGFEPPEKYPAPVYSIGEEVCMELMDDGSLVEAECP